MSGASEAPPHLWLYWEHSENVSRAAYLDLCLETIYRHSTGLECHLLDETSVYDWLPDLDKELWRSLPSPVHRSDYCRVRLLSRYGGLWLDVDTVAVGPLGRLLAPLRGYEFASWGHELGRLYNNLMVARPGSRLLEEWSEAQDAAVRGWPDRHVWSRSSLGQDIIGPIADAHPWHSFTRRDVAPIMWWEWKRFLSRFEDPERLISCGPSVIMLWNAELGPALSAASRSELLSGPQLISRLLRLGLGLTSMSDERSWLHHASFISALRHARLVRSLEVRLMRVQESE